MSQEKIDNRKKSKGDMIHDLKIKLRTSVVITFVVMLLAGGFACVVTYNKAYDKGHKQGLTDELNEMMALGLLNTGATTAASSETTTAAGETTAAAGETTAAAGETTAASEEATTAAAEETTAAK